MHTASWQRELIERGARANDGTQGPASAPISILACGGSLPLEIAQILRSKGCPTNIVSIAGLADADYSDFPLTSVSILRVGALLAALRSNGAREMLIAGHARRPDLRSLNVDWGFVRHFFTILSLTRGGDDRVLRKIAAFFERNGMTIKSIAEVAPSLLTPAGALTGTLSPDCQAAATSGLRLVHKLGPFDVGQAVLVDKQRIAAIEGAEGTNGLIARLPTIDQSAGNAGAGRVLVKAAKPEQDLRFDLPTIGPETIEKCANAGIATIALEAGRSLILSRAETLEQANAAGITVVGLDTTSNGRRDETRPRVTQSPLRLTNHTHAIASPQFSRDAGKGLRLLATLAARTPARAAIVARENILAINLAEPTRAFIERTEQLGQWGDRREKTKRNRALVITSLRDMEPDLLEWLKETKIAGIAMLDTTGDPACLDQVVNDADSRNFFVLSPE